MADPDTVPVVSSSTRRMAPGGSPTVAEEGA